MRFTGLLLLAASAVLLTGCSDLVSLNPFIEAKDAIVDPALTGTWKGDNSLFVIQQEDDGYAITYTEKNEAAKFRATLLQSADAKILDLVVDGDDDAFRVPVHLLARVWVQGSSLRWTFLDSKWLREQTAVLPNQIADKRTLLTAQPEALRTLVLKYATDDRAYEGTPMELTKQ